MNLAISNENIKKMLEALQHSAQSTHHSYCSIKKTNHCSCHVAKAAEALEILKKTMAETLVILEKAMKESAGAPRTIFASDAKVGQWIVFDDSLNQRIVEVSATRDGEIRIHADFGGGGEPGTLFFKSDETIVVIDGCG